ncbi:acyl carrier protein [Desulfobulbus alkaliphilus]|uniref:acyl carrier protein n=1 Tax=Desulfobulbus alkaliphilus TaxID=869814 RepID=UPI001963C1CC|nr:acyl carrier protein [Desulfobulbus alkaliphilus]MBM9538569.1 acyl carrier protein [Desulfobulbus alkaliphilus]
MLEKLTANLAEILECDPDELSGETIFRDHDAWDSLAYLSVIAMIDEEFNITIPQQKFNGLKTIADMATYIESNSSL